MNQDMLERVLSCPTLPTLPAVAVRILELTQQRNVSVDELASAIQNDQALTTKVLRTINCSFYGLRKPCASINQAIVMLGLAAVKSLTLGFSLVAAVPQDGAAGFDFISYWRRGLHTAVAAKCIAHEAGLASEDEAFLGGLLQDVGMVAMFQALGPAYLEVLRKSGGDHRTLIRHELAELEVQHPEVGAMLCERWKLPPELLLPVRFHERPTAAPEDYGPLVRSVGLGNIAHDVLTDDEPSHALRRFRERAARWFEFDGETCEALIRRIAEGAKQVAPLFQLSTGSVVDAEQILAEAKAQLTLIDQSEERDATRESSLGSLVSDSDQFDALTGALAAQAMIRTLEELFAGAMEQRRSLTVIVAGLDGTAELNRSAVSEAGDAALVEMFSLLQEQIEPLGGRVSRWDPGTFCAVIPGVDRSESLRICGEIRAAVQSQSPRWGIAGGPDRFTASVGAASMESGDRAFTRSHQLVTAAARARDAAVSGGGNRVRAFVPKLAA